MTSTVDLDTLLDRVVEAVRKQLDYGFVAIGLRTDENKSVLKGISSLYPVDLPIGYTQEIGVGVTGEVVGTGKSLLVPDVRKRENFVPTHKTLLCEMCCPLKVGDRVVGYLDAEEPTPYAFDENDLMVFETVADHIAQAVENAENLRRINKLREELSNMIVHDLRNPLSIILSSLEMLDMPELRLSETKQKRYMQSAKTSCNELLTLLDSLLELQKIEVGRLELHRDLLDPAEVVRNIVNSFQVKAEIGGKSLTCDIPEKLPKIEVDRRLFIRVIQNLVINAMKFTRRGGRIHILIQKAPENIIRKYLKPGNAAVLISVQDDGCGIPRDELQNIFDKFTTLKTLSPGTQHGTGLGLTFCREITLAHRGAIWAESQPGKGSTFYLLLPLG